MPRVMAVAFEPLGRLHYLDPGADDYAFGQSVLVATPEGTEVAQCVWGPAEVEWSGDLPKCLGAAGAGDLERDGANRRRRAEIAAVARRLISRRGLSMRVVGVDFVDQSDAFDQQAVVYYEAPGRVDFRELLVDLARTLQSRIDLRQVGARDAAALLGGLGPCGREVCCATMGPRRATVPGGLARDQAPLHSQSQLQGTCGRTMCCLAYESRLYADFRDRAPRTGEVVATDEGTGVVVGHNVPLDAVVVQTGAGRFTCPLGRVCPLSGTDAD
ncbi:PSP1 domain-containing protein [Propionicimonas sp.]|uniref:PSP1 domain-containing protein n=1 Tax=Propionicimonas sp. TaxID=1955623 RepID=UPI0039E3244A